MGSGSRLQMSVYSSHRKLWTSLAEREIAFAFAFPESLPALP
uniref:Uncharacterized protein n=1 Tax=Ciona intestinalis TaxID=7719 RepID=H2XM02_CIOIN